MTPRVSALMGLANALVVGLMTLLAVLVLYIVVAKATYAVEQHPLPSHVVTVTGDVCEEDEAIVGFGDYVADRGYSTYRCFAIDDLPVDAWPL